jgi:hypothetical protein
VVAGQVHAGKEAGQRSCVAKEFQQEDPWGLKGKTVVSVCFLLHNKVTDVE